VLKHKTARVLAVLALIVSITTPASAQDSTETEHERRVEFVEAAADYHPRANYTNVAQGDQPAMTLAEWNTAWNVVVSAYLAAGDIVAELSEEIKPHRDAWQAALKAWRDSPEYDVWMQAHVAWQECSRDMSARASRRACGSELQAKKAARAAGKQLYAARTSALEAYRHALDEFDDAELRRWERRHNQLRRVFVAVRCAGGELGWEGTWPRTATYFHYIPGGGAGADDIYGYRRDIGAWSDSITGDGQGGTYVVAEGFKSKYCSDDI